MFQCAPPIEVDIVWVDPCPWQITCSLPDLNNDGEVGIMDFIDLIMLWGPSDCSKYRKGDINFDGTVGIEDLLIILSVWGIYDPATWNRCNC